MKPLHLPTLRQLAAGAAAACALAAASAPARAENHALIMWIGDYGSERNNLPGIDLDAANARKIATAMGVGPQNITEISNANLTTSAIAGALQGLVGRIRDGDKVFLYYSGHGAQVQGRGTAARCTEAMVARDGLFFDGELQDALNRLGAKASQVVMMNDSCFSGGAATRSLAAPPAGDRKAKFFVGDTKANTAVTDGYSCGDPVNANKMTRSLDVLAKDARGPQVLYVAASNDTQVSFATRKGSLATLAWVACLTSANADTNGSGSINGEEMQECAQAVIDSLGAKQTIMLQGNAKLPLSFVQAAVPATPPAAQAPPSPQTPQTPQAPQRPQTPAAPAAPSVAAVPTTPTAPAVPAPPAAPAAASPAVNAAQALHDLRAAADRGYQVQLVLARSSLRIGQDFLDFSVATNRDGYVYLLQVGSDGKTFNLLFPNKIDGDNFLPAGTHRFPRASWRVRAGGPVGASHLLAIVSPVKKDLAREMDMSSVFPSSAATAAATRTLVVEATGAAAGGAGRYGASDVASLNETN